MKVPRTNVTKRMRALQENATGASSQGFLSSNVNTRQYNITRMLASTPECVALPKQPKVKRQKKKTQSTWQFFLPSVL